MEPTKWNLAQLWNEVAYKDNRPLQKRDYIYASEVGAPFIDRYLKMKATPYTNPPNQRSLRKFLAGNIWEHVVKQILIACGVYKWEEVKVDATPYSDCLSVHGRLDFKAGGYIDEELAFQNLKSLQLPDFLQTVAGKIIESLSGALLEEKILELKAVSTFAMDMVERRGGAIPQHIMQSYHYQKNAGIKAEICYCCKDDCRLAQFGINEKDAEPLYKDDIEQMTHFFTKKKMPPKAPLAKFDNTIGKFSKNLGVEYSPYLTMVYGFEHPDAYREAVSFVEKWNRTLTRFVLAETDGTTPTGKPIAITPKNREVEAEIIKSGYKMHELIECKIALGAIEEEAEAE